MLPPKPIELIPTSEPYETRLNFQQKQIADLTEQRDEYRQRATENTEAAVKLRQDLKVQEQRSVQSLKNLQERWKTERAEWKKSVDQMEKLLRLSELDTKLALYNARLEEMRWNENARLKEIAVLARDFKITEFQVSSQDNERTLGASLEKSKALQRQVHSLNAECSVYKAELRDEQEQCSILEQEIEKLKEELEGARAQHQAALKESKSATVASQSLERLKLELDDAKSENITLDGQLTEMQRANAELKRQLEKWKRLEEKGNEDAKNLVHLGVEKGELEERVKELEKTERGHNKELRKLHAQVTSMKDKLSKTEEALAEKQSELEEALQTVKQSQRTLEKSRTDAERSVTEQKKEKLSHPTKSRPKGPKAAKMSARPTSSGAASGRAGGEDGGASEDTERERETTRSRSEDTGRVSKRGREEDTSAEPKRGKRKLNVFPTGPQTGFSWGASEPVPSAGDLGIPTELSPIRDPAPVKRTNSLLGRLTNHMW